MAKPDLAACLAALARRYPEPPLETELPGGALGLILWETVAYLVDEARRAALFAEFVQQVGLTAEAIAGADPAILAALAARGGMRPEQRIARWREIAALVAATGGDLDAALSALPAAKARALLKRFPTIGDPGADKVLLFAGVVVTPALESNGLRTLVRLGLAAEGRNYGATYRAGVEALARDGPASREGLIAAYGALRAHGRALCRRGAPQCLACPLDEACGHVEVMGEM